MSELEKYVEPEEMLLHVTGSVEGDMMGIVGISMCGDISDGVPIRWKKDNASFVLSFKDLEKFYLANKAIRIQRTESQGGEEDKNE